MASRNLVVRCCVAQIKKKIYLCFNVAYKTLTTGNIEVKKKHNNFNKRREIPTW